MKSELKVAYSHGIDIFHSLQHTVFPTHTNRGSVLKPSKLCTFCMAAATQLTLKLSCHLLLLLTLFSISKALHHPPRWYYRSSLPALPCLMLPCVGGQSLDINAVYIIIHIILTDLANLTTVQYEAHVEVKH